MDSESKEIAVQKNGVPVKEYTFKNNSVIRITYNITYSFPINEIESHYKNWLEERGWKIDNNYNSQTMNEVRFYKDNMVILINYMADSINSSHSRVVYNSWYYSPNCRVQ
jgi:hypothetical protein